ncbi:MAG: hypothetical protein IKI26_10075 [Prevotella sp.]|nr:hypothetical protein [Prevotella sp.]
MPNNQIGTIDAEILRNLGIVAKNEVMLLRVAKYLRKIVKEMHVDSTEFTREDFFSRIDKAKNDIAEGKGHRFSNVEELDQYIKSL